MMTVVWVRIVETVVMVMNALKIQRPQNPTYLIATTQNFRLTNFYLRPPNPTHLSDATVKTQITYRLLVRRAG